MWSGWLYYIDTSSSECFWVFSYGGFPQMAPAGFGAGLLLLLGGLSFITLKYSTTWLGTSANTLFASASRGA